MEIRQLTAAEAEVYRDLRLEDCKQIQKLLALASRKKRICRLSRLQVGSKDKEHLHLGHLTGGFTRCDDIGASK